jgi:deazaflavin-dependent oxidoreductase (nitroreductase family)
MDTTVLKWSQGRKSLTTMLTGLPVVVLSTTGARSGVTRTTPVAGIPDGEKIILIPSNFGSTAYPDWYYNLRAHPEVKLSLNGQIQEYVARIADQEERQNYWQLAVYYYPGYQSYGKRNAGREIPIFVLEPVG